jgi:membrane protein DedA with SNARE-associated domain
MKKILNFVILSYALWGSLLIVVGLYVSSNQKNKLLTEQEMLSPLLILHIFLLIASAYPIIKWEKRILVKALVLIIHYLLVLLFSFYILFIGLVSIHGWKN